MCYAIARVSGDFLETRCRASGESIPGSLQDGDSERLVVWTDHRYDSMLGESPLRTFVIKLGIIVEAEILERGTWEIDVSEAVRKDSRSWRRSPTRILGYGDGRCSVGRGNISSHQDPGGISIQVVGEFASGIASMAPTNARASGVTTGTTTELPSCL